MVLTLPERKAGDPPPAPAFFDERYRLPEHVEYDSCKRNHHDLDDGHYFLQGPHVYGRHRNQQPFSSSVTALAHQYEHGFDGPVAIDLMRRSRKQRWPRSEYVLGLATAVPDELSCDLGCLLKRRGMTAGVLRPHTYFNLTGRELYSNLLGDCDAPVPQEGDELFTYVRAMSDGEILASWEANGLDKRNRGTEAHLQMQLFTEGEPFRWDAEVVVGWNFLKGIPDEWEVYRTEMELSSEEEDVAGSVDAILMHKHRRTIIIVDYKRSSKLPDRMHGFGKMKAPMQHLDDCDGAKYALQLSLYQWILAKYYGLDCEGLILMSVAPDRPFWTTVPYLADEVEFIMEERRHIVAARAKCDMRCPLCPEVALFDAVVVEHDGRLMSVNRKTAQLRGIEILHSDETTSALVREEVERTRERASLGQLVPWKRLMPKQGVPPTFQD